MLGIYGLVMDIRPLQLPLEVPRSQNSGRDDTNIKQLASAYLAL
jgi:hypothetical protein